MNELGGHAAIPPSWLAMALDPPRAAGTPAVTGRLRATPADFHVEELLGFEPDGGVAHLLLKVEKTDANTLYVARQLARFAGIRAADVGFAGLKDRRAVAVQWFTVPAGRPVEDWASLTQDSFRVLEAHPHARKLRRGALAGNRFRIVLRDLQGDLESLQGRLQRVAAEGAPNYFGPQRFGRQASNLAGVAAWLAGTRLPRDRDQRAFLLSAARSLAFNQVLAERVAAHSWDRLLTGEVVNLDGTGSVFLAEALDETLLARCAGLDLHPTGPLPGRDGKSPAGQAGEAEAEALAPLAALVEALAAADVEASRRALRVRVADLAWTLDADALAVSFSLPKGAFATAVLREVLDLADSDLPD